MLVSAAALVIALVGNHTDAPISIDTKSTYVGTWNYTPRTRRFTSSDIDHNTYVLMSRHTTCTPPSTSTPMATCLINTFGTQVHGHVEGRGRRPSR